MIKAIMLIAQYGGVVTVVAEKETPLSPENTISGRKLKISLFGSVISAFYDCSIFCHFLNPDMIII